LLISPSTTEVDTLSLHDALPIFAPAWESYRRRSECSALDDCPACKKWLSCGRPGHVEAKYTIPTPAQNTRAAPRSSGCDKSPCINRKSTRLNSSHVKISYAVFCL